MWYPSHMRYPSRRHFAVHDAAGVRHQHALHAGLGRHAIDVPRKCEV